MRNSRQKSMADALVWPEIPAHRPPAWLGALDAPAHLAHDTRTLTIATMPGPRPLSLIFCVAGARPSMGGERWRGVGQRKAKRPRVSFSSTDEVVEYVVLAPMRALLPSFARQTEERSHECHAPKHLSRPPAFPAQAAALRARRRRRRRPRSPRCPWRSSRRIRS